MSKRFRMFAGPNGSRKSTLIKTIRNDFSIGYFVNADEIENFLNQHKYLLLENYLKKKITQQDWENFTADYQDDVRFKNRAFPKFSISDNILTLKDPKNTIDSYVASVIAEFLRLQLLLETSNFSFETVMSHLSKVDFLQQAKKAGFKTYLYFICTQDPEINIARVHNRVYKGGHDVENEKIKERYYRSLELLPKAFLLAGRVFVIDNSNVNRTVILEKNGKDVLLHTSKVPEWVNEFLLKKIETQ
ncbi:MAG: hypothetical protein RBT61_01020 [Candidatus Kapabacteria bacterium]|nr:hypothetical protein [Candidatus Kapabacteria bacterium]